MVKKQEEIEITFDVDCFPPKEIVRQGKVITVYGGISDQKDLDKINELARGHRINQIVVHQAAFEEPKTNIISCQKR